MIMFINVVWSCLFCIVVYYILLSRLYKQFFVSSHDYGTKQKHVTWREHVQFDFTPRGCRLKLLLVCSLISKVIFSNPSLSAWYCSPIHNGDLRYVKCGLYINLYVFRCILIWFKLVVAHLFWFPLFPHVCDLVYVGSLIYSAEPSIIRIRHC